MMLAHLHQRLFILFYHAYLCLSLSLCSTHGFASDTTGLHRTIKVGDKEREFFIKLPRQTASAVILAFHGGGGKAEKFESVSGDLSSQALARGFAIVYPQGLDHRWNDGRSEMRKPADDIAFFDALLLQLEREGLPVKKVYVTGISNGGLFSFRLACERSERVRAIAPVAAGMGLDLSRICLPKEGVSILQIFGSEDSLVPREGGPIKLPLIRLSRGQVLSQKEGWNLWQKLNHCQGRKTDTFLPSPPADFPVMRDRFTDCPPGIEGEHLLVVGAGHTWPGGLPYLGTWLVGAVSKSFEANGYILEFFARNKVSELAQKF